MAGNKITKINLNGVEYNLTDLSAQDRLDNVQTQVGGIVDLIPTKVSLLTNDSNFQTAALVNLAIQKIVGAAPEALDTLEEIAAKLEGNDNVIDAINGVLAGKANSSEVYTRGEVDEAIANIDMTPQLESYLTKNEAEDTYITYEGLDQTLYDLAGNEGTTFGSTVADVNDLKDSIKNKIDKETGKGLSTNDYTNIDKTKLAGIEEGAEVNQNAYSSISIKNSDGTARQVVSNAKNATFNLEVDENLTASANGDNGLKLSVNIPLASTTKAGLMSSDDKTKLDTLPDNTYSTDELDSASELVLNALNSKLDSEVFNDIIEGYAKKDSVVTSVAGKTGVVTLTKSDVGLGNVTNTSDMNKPVSTALLAAIDEVHNETATVSADLDKHKQDPFKHLPDSNEKSGKVLTSSESNISQWKYLSEIIPNLEEIAAYGVEWDVTVPDPHLTRIGNLSLHKTLPILSLLRGCIALGDEIMYWLDEEDWNFKAGAKPLTKMIADPDGHNTLDDNLSLGNYILYYTNKDKNQLFYVLEEINISEIREDGQVYATYTKNGSNVDINSFPGAYGYIYSKDTLSRLDGYDGTVRVYCPDFYVKSKINGNKRLVLISTAAIDDAWIHQPSCLIDANRCTILHEVPEDMGYLSTLPVGSAISIVNTDAYCRGGKNNEENDTMLDKAQICLGKPTTLITTRANMRTAARKAGSNVLAYNLYKNIFYWLYVIEYANFNVLESYNASLTTEGYHLGGLGEGITSDASIMWDMHKTPITPCGYLNYLGNSTGIGSITYQANPSGSNKMSYAHRWRGFDNIFGEADICLEGIIIENTGNIINVYTCDDPAEYNDTNSTNYKFICTSASNSGYITELNLGDTAEIIPLSCSGGGSGIAMCDIYSPNSNSGLYTLRVGGRPTFEDAAGLIALGFLPLLGDAASSTGITFRTVSVIS